MKRFGFMLCLLVLTLVSVGCVPSPKLIGTPTTGGLVVIAFEVSINFINGHVIEAQVRNVETGVITISSTVLSYQEGFFYPSPRWLVLFPDMQEGRYRLGNIEFGGTNEEEGSYVFYTLVAPPTVIFSAVPGKVTYAGKMQIDASAPSGGRSGELYSHSEVYQKKYKAGLEIRALKRLRKSYKESPWGKPIRDRLDELEEAKHDK